MCVYGPGVSAASVVNLQEESPYMPKSMHTLTFPHQHALNPRFHTQISSYNPT